MLFNYCFYKFKMFENICFKVKMFVKKCIFAVLQDKVFFSELNVRYRIDSFMKIIACLKCGKCSMKLS